ncbi:MAG TPA: ATP-binding cassette domain-containing protein [Spirochaetota bacterium]|nr:ATP-binding cassette domain-containing protein [Spirochaetota bacterium]
MIEVDNLSKKYGDFLALENINFSVNKGEILGLLGPNGAGKTTTIRILCSYLAPTSGTIRIKDLDVQRNDIATREKIGYLPESAPLYKDMIVYDYLAFIASLRRINDQAIPGRIKELSATCGIGEVVHKSINELSKGYRQRVGLAQALMSDPEILVLDEPTSGLDPNQIIEIRELIKKISKEKTIILCSHILSEIEATCDRVVIINEGRIAADGTLDELKNKHGSASYITARFKDAAADSVSSELKTITGIDEVKVNSENDNSITARIKVSGSEDISSAVFNLAKSREWTLVNLNQESSSLESIFLELTSK